MAKKSEIKPLIRDEWVAWAGDDRSVQTLVLFYPHLQKNRPDLLNFRCAGDKWQEVKLMLKGLY